MIIEQLRFLNIAFEDCSIDNSSEIVEDFCAGERKTCSLILMKAQNFKETGLYFLGTPRNYIIIFNINTVCLQLPARLNLEFMSCRLHFRAHFPLTFNMK